MPVNPGQYAFINGAGRPFMETFIRGVYNLDDFVADYDALQASIDALPEDATALDDGRTDAPALTGADLKNLRDFAANMSAVLTPAAKQILIGLMVRPLTKVRNGG